MRTLIVAIATAFFLTQAAYAQPAPIPGESPKEKAANEAKRRELKDLDARYKATMKNIPDAEKPADPWAGTRVPGATPRSK